MLAMLDCEIQQAIQDAQIRIKIVAGDEAVRLARERIDNGDVQVMPFFVEYNTSRDSTHFHTIKQLHMMMTTSFIVLEPVDSIQKIDHLPDSLLRSCCSLFAKIRREQGQHEWKHRASMHSVVYGKTCAKPW